MLAPSLAIGWTIWRRHRWGLTGVLIYVSAAVAAAAVLPRYFEPETGGAIAAILTTPLVYVAMYLMGVFSYGFEADLNARHSCFPAVLFILPVRTGALVAWPVAYGALALVLLWLVTAGLILSPSLAALNLAGALRPADLAVPLWWPAMLIMAALALVQALLWSALGLPVVRIVLAVLVLSGVVTAAEFAVMSGVSEGILAGVFFGVAAIGWLSAYVGVCRARRGAVPSWVGFHRLLGLLTQRRPRRSRPFASAARAQTWFEWRRNGLGLTLMTALVLPFVLLPLIWGQNDAIPISRTMGTALFMPVFLAGIAATTVSGKNAWAKDYYGVAPFTATLPMATAGMIAAKLKAAAWSTLAVWILMALVVPAAVALTGNGGEVAGWWRQAVREHGALRVVAGLAAAGILLLVWTWKNLVHSVFLGLNGRKWVIQGAIIVGMTLFVSLSLLALWVYHHPATHETVFTLLPWLMGLFLLCRILATIWVLKRGIAQGLLTTATVRRGVLAWGILAVMLIGLLVWSVPAERRGLQYLVLGVLLILPMTRLAATPLALAWNRHR